MSATVAMLPAAKANRIERLFLNLRIMNPPRSVDKNVIKANMIAVGFISNTSLITFSKLVKGYSGQKKAFILSPHWRHVSCFSVSSDGMKIVKSAWSSNQAGKSRMKAAVSSGRAVLMNIPVPSSKPAGVTKRGRIWRCQW